MWLTKCTFHCWLGISVWGSHILQVQESVWLKALVLESMVLDHSVLNGFVFGGESGQIPSDRCNESNFQGQKKIRFWVTDGQTKKIKNPCPHQEMMSSLPHPFQISYRLFSPGWKNQEKRLPTHGCGCHLDWCGWL